ncbi:MAG: sialate O-acetylesterase [Bacteroidales bacterium]|nr:sialate O-acetylesterase [Bacteroidales bacterium]
MNRLWIVLAAALLSQAAARAEVTLPSFFTDNMLLQQQSRAALWGTATPNRMVRVKTSWNNRETKVMADEQGSWKCYVETPVAGGPYYIVFNDGQEKVVDNVLIGELWFCSGQSNMEQPMKGYTSQSIENAERDIFLSTDASLRLFTVSRAARAELQDDVKGAWAEAEPAVVQDFSATAYHFGRFLRQALNVPVGLIVSSWGGTPAQAWTSGEYLADFPEYPVPQAGQRFTGNTPSALYNGMVHPFLGLTMRGVIWYQGESNYERPDLYARLFTKMVQCWRENWGIGEFPFYYCQIAPYDYSIITKSGEPVINSAYLREAQLQAEEMIPNSAMVVLMDGGLKGGIHPRKKQLAGERLAMKALAGTYGFKIPVESPRLASMEVRDSVAVLTFDHSPKYLDCTRGELQWFTIAGEDSIFYPAQAKIKWNSNIIEVQAPQVARPVAVRYAFSNWADGDLFGQNGWPVSSFRTDDWPIKPECIKE